MIFSMVEGGWEKGVCWVGRMRKGGGRERAGWLGVGEWVAGGVREGFMLGWGRGRNGGTAAAASMVVGEVLARGPKALVALTAKTERDVEAACGV